MSFVASRLRTQAQACVFVALPSRPQRCWRCASSARRRSFMKALVEPGRKLEGRLVQSSARERESRDMCGGAVALILGPSSCRARCSGRVPERLQAAPRSLRPAGPEPPRLQREREREARRPGIPPEAFRRLGRRRTDAPILAPSATRPRESRKVARTGRGTDASQKACKHKSPHAAREPWYCCHRMPVWSRIRQQVVVSR